MNPSTPNTVMKQQHTVKFARKRRVDGLMKDRIEDIDAPLLKVEGYHHGWIPQSGRLDH